MHHSSTLGWKIYAKKKEGRLQWGIGRKKIYPALIYWYQQTGPAQFGQNHPPSSFSPHQVITATNQSWVDFFSADAPLTDASLRRRWSYICKLDLKWHCIASSLIYHVWTRNFRLKSSVECWMCEKIIAPLATREMMNHQQACVVLCAVNWDGISSIPPFTQDLSMLFTIENPWQGIRGIVYGHERCSRDRCEYVLQ